jgi:hypothetical protein
VSALLIILLIWLGLGVLVIAAGLMLSRGRGPDSYLVMTTIKGEEQTTAEAPEYREAA